MRDLMFLHGELPLTEAPGLDTLDPRFSRITDLAERGAFEDAAREVQELIDAKVYDIRLLAYLFFQVFREDGLVGSIVILGATESLLDRNWEAFGPTKNREKYVEKSLTWLFSRMADGIEYHRKKNDETHRSWRKSVDPVNLAAGLEASRSLIIRLVPPTYPHAGEALGRLLRELREARETALSEAPPPPKNPSDVKPAAEPTPERKSAQLPAFGGNDTVELQVSPQFVELCRKLQAFEKLIEKRSFEKAALVGDDLMTLIENFDPRKYFPDLFASFGALLSANVSSIAPHWDRRNSLEWKTLQQFYQVDIRKFVGD